MAVILKTRILKQQKHVINPKHLSFRNLDPVITITALLFYKH